MSLQTQIQKLFRISIFLVDLVSVRPGN